MFRLVILCLVLGMAMIGSPADATTFDFATDPFAGTPVRTIPGRQIVGGEEFITFSTAQDVFEFDAAVFGVGNQVHFANGLAGTLPAGGVNVVVLQSLDDDDNPLTPFGAGNAADLIAARITTPGPGFFVYFNQSLDLPRLVFSTDLSDNSADLRILARMLNLQGHEEELSDFTASNFSIVPEPSTLLLVAGTGAVSLCGRRMRRRSGNRG